jgi:hypothetical protein
MTNLKRILYVDESSRPSRKLINYLMGRYDPGIDFSKKPKAAERDLVKFLREECFIVDCPPNPKTAESYFLTKTLKAYFALIANLSYVYEHESLILAENPHLKLVLMSKSSKGTESVNQDKRVLRCGYNPERIARFINGELDFSKLPGSAFKYPRQLTIETF